MMHDVVGSSGLAVFAEIGLVVFFAVFVVAAVRVLRRPSADYDAMARMPLEDDGGVDVGGRAGLRDGRRSET